MRAIMKASIGHLRTYGQSVRKLGHIRLFEGAEHAQFYAKFRPSYPQEVYETIASRGPGRRELAVDVACGSGQSTTPLAAHYSKVIGVDVSKAQLSQAAETSCVTYRHGPAEDLSFLEDGSVDALTCAQGAHWLELAKFYKEANRVLRKGGVLSLYGYGNAILKSREAQDIVTNFYDNTLDGYWSPERKHIDNAYQDIKLPYPDFQRIENISIGFSGNLDGFVGYLKSWSAYMNFTKKNPGETAMQDVADSLRKVLQVDKNDNNPVVALHWPVFILIGTKP